MILSFLGVDLLLKLLKIGTKGTNIIIGLEEGDGFHLGFKILDIDHYIRIDHIENHLEEGKTPKLHFTCLPTSIHELLLVN